MMQKITIEELYFIYKQFPVVCTDTRNIKKGSLFFALKGGNFNGNEFAAKALEMGSEYAIVDEEEFCISEKYLFVEDVLTALQNLAKHHRKQLKIPFIGITGSNGKTTSKELIHAVLSTKFKTLSTQGNLNNHIGVPLTLLSITAAHQMAVIEMGANHMKEIEFLCTLASPDFGIITNIGKAHLEGFGSAENVVKGKNELYEHIKSKAGILFVNGDNEQLMSLSKNSERVCYGSGEENSFVASFEGANPFVQLTLKTFTKTRLVKTQIIGKYNFDNCIAAACIGNYFGVSESDIASALENYIPSNNRSQVIHKGSNTILMDAYNANPSSMEVAIINFAEMKAENKMVILGDMLELGKESEMEHQRIADLLLNKGIKKVLLVGPLFMKINNTLGAILVDDSKKASEYIAKQALKNSTLLVKGSRGIKLEAVLEAIQ